MKRCYACSGGNHERANFCKQCGEPFDTVAEPNPSDQNNMIPYTSPAGTAIAIISQLHHNNLPEVTPRHPQAIQLQVADRARFDIMRRVKENLAFDDVLDVAKKIAVPDPQIRGTVISDLTRSAIDAPFDYWKLMTILILAALLLPIFLISIVIYAVLAVLLLMCRLGCVLSVLNPFNLLGLCCVLGSGNRGRREVPTADFRIRDEAGAERDIKITGHLKTGNILKGDFLEIWRKWRGGVLVLSKARNLRTYSNVELKGTPWKAIFYLLVTGISVGALYLYVQFNGMM